MKPNYYFSRVRKANQLHWPIADNVEDIVIPYYLTRYSGNDVDEKFLLADSGNVPNRILIFGRFMFYLNTFYSRN